MPTAVFATSQPTQTTPVSYSHPEGPVTIPQPPDGREARPGGGARRKSRSRDKSGPRRGNSSSRSGSAGQQGSPGWSQDGTTHDQGQQSGSRKKAQT
ncbi:hypothetical protein MTO96_037608, partial [Rhipicephalus appendiculatus]